MDGQGEPPIRQFQICFSPQPPCRLYKDAVEAVVHRLWRGHKQPCVHDSRGRLYARCHPAIQVGKELSLWDDNSKKELFLAVELDTSSKVKLPRSLISVINTALSSSIPRHEKIGKTVCSFPCAKAIYIGDGLGLWHGNFKADLGLVHSKSLASCSKGSSHHGVTKDQELDYSSNYQPGKLFVTQDEDESLELNCWGLVNIDPRTRCDSVLLLGEEIEKRGEELGVKMGRPRFCLNVASTPGFLRRLRDTFLRVKSEGTQLVVVVIPSTGQYYGRVKRLAETKVGLVTQLVKGSTAYRIKEPALSNIVHKICTKMRESPYAMKQPVWPSILRSPVMIMAGDLVESHLKTSPSIATVAATFDPVGVKSQLQWRLQKPGEEIEALEDMTKRHLVNFHTLTSGHKPLRIIYFRLGSGLSPQVLKREVLAIKRACSSLEEDYDPPVTCLQVDRGTNKKEVRGLSRQNSVQLTSYGENCRRVWDETGSSGEDYCTLWRYLCRPMPSVASVLPTPVYCSHHAASLIVDRLLGKTYSEKELEVEETVIRNFLEEELPKKVPLFSSA